MQFKFRDKPTKDAVHAYIDKCADGAEYEVSIKRFFKKRSVPQNRLYWLYVSCIMDETGNDRDTIHNELREMFLPVRFGELGIKQTKNLTSTTTLNTKQFKEYTDRIIAWAASELGIALPDPEDQYFEQFYEQYRDYI